MGAAVNSPHFASATPSSSGRARLTLFPCSSVGSLPWETALLELLQPESFPRGAVLHKLLQCRSPMGSQVLPAKLLQRGLLSPQVLPGACSSAGLPGVHRLLWAPTCSGLGTSLGCRWRPAPLWAIMGCRDNSLPHQGLHQGLQGNLCSGAWRTSSHSFFTDFGVCRIVSLTYSHSFLWLKLLGFPTPHLTMLSQRHSHRC